MSFPASHAGGVNSGEPRSEPMKRHESLQLLESPKVPRTEEPPVPEPKVKAARTGVRMVYDVEAITTEEVGLEEVWDAYPMDFKVDKDDTELQKGEDEGPPQLSEEQVAILDSEAALEEIKKLYDLTVIGPCTLDPFSVLPEQLVDTTIVKDWRFREGNSRRRCRIVAREYRNSQTNEDQYSPTSSFAAVRLLLAMALIHNLSVTSLDVKDAFLVVEQREVMFVEVPVWIRGLIHKDNNHTHWRLLHCLPGQRNAAMRWKEHFTALCVESGFQPYPGCSTVMRMIQGDRRVYLSVHVDDIIFVCKPEDVAWFSQTMGRTLTMKRDGPHLLGGSGFLHYLKKKITLTPEGILIQPNNTYIPKLIALLNISGRRGKGLAYHSTLESYNAELDLEQERLQGEQAVTFRSALGLILYIAQDRPDIKFPTKILATYMAHPCIKALAAVKHLALYLSGTETSGILLRACEPYDTVFDRWNESEIVEPDL